MIDACNSMGPYVSVKAMELAMEKARHTGVAFVTVKNSNHNGIAAYYAERALPNGMIGIAATNSKARMAVYGGREPFLGTNPFAVAIPADQQRPIIADMATSVVARGKVAAAAKNKQPLPPGWALDKEGEPTTDSAEGLKGTVVPFAGYKGSAIAMVIDVLTAVLSGSLYRPLCPGPLHGFQRAGVHQPRLRRDQRRSLHLARQIQERHRPDDYRDQDRQARQRSQRDFSAG